MTADINLVELMSRENSKLIDEIRELSEQMDSLENVVNVMQSTFLPKKKSKPTGLKLKF